MTDGLTDEVRLESPRTMMLEDDMIRSESGEQVEEQVQRCAAKEQNADEQK